MVSFPIDPRPPRKCLREGKPGPCVCNSQAYVTHDMAQKDTGHKTKLNLVQRGTNYPVVGKGISFPKAQVEGADALWKTLASPMESLKFPGNDDHGFGLKRCSALALAGVLCLALGGSNAHLHIETEARASNSQ